MSYSRRSYEYSPGLGKRTGQGALVGIIPAAVTGNPAWIGYGAAAGLGYGLLEGKNAFGGGNKRRKINKRTIKSKKYKSKSKSRYRSKARSPKRK
jgi:hypothetical protein